MSESLIKIWESLRGAAAEVLEFLPFLILALIFVVLGWLVAGLVRKLVVRVLSYLFSHKPGEQVERALGVDLQQRTKNVELLGSLFFWSIIFMTLILCLNVLGLEVGASIAARLLEIIPGILVASLILILGMVFAVLVEQVVSVILKKAKAMHYLAWSKVLKWITLAFVILLALEQIGIAAKVFISLIQILIAAAALSLALAFGMGCKDIAREIVIEFFKKEEKPGL